MSFDFENIAKRESAWLAGQEARIASQLVRDYQRALLDIEYRLIGYVPGEYQHARLLAIKHQLEQVIDNWQNSSALGVGRKLGEVAQASSERAIATRAELMGGIAKMPLDSHVLGITQFNPRLPQYAIRELALRTRMDLGVLGAEIKRGVFGELTQSLIHGEGVPQMVKRLRRAVPIEETGATTKKGYTARLELIARMRTADARTTGTQEAHKALNKEAPGSVAFEMIMDRVDKTPSTRNHFFSWAAHGTIRRLNPEEPFRIPLSEIDQAHAEFMATTGRKVKKVGILWYVAGGYYEGFGIPAHYGDRATVIAWHPAYGQALGIAPKHPELEKILKGSSYG